MILTAGELIFMDTNILLSATDVSRKEHSAAKNILGLISNSGYHTVVSGQVLREYLVVATRPLNTNGFGMSSGDAVHNLKEFQKKIIIYDERRSTADLLQHMVVRHQLKGKRIHDANIVATMKTHGIKILLTQNKADFNCFEELRVFNIEELYEVLHNL